MRTKLKIHSLAQPDFCARAKGNLNISLSADKKRRRWRVSQKRQGPADPEPRAPSTPAPIFPLPREHRYVAAACFYVDLAAPRRPNADLAAAGASTRRWPGALAPLGRRPIGAAPLPFRQPPARFQPHQEFPRFQTTRHKIDTRRADPYSCRGRHPGAPTPTEIRFGLFRGRCDRRRASCPPKVAEF